MIKILVINPGSTSTKISLFQDEREILNVNLKHSSIDLNRFTTIHNQYKFRKNAISKFLKKNNINLSSIEAIACRGGAIGQYKSGVYKVTKKYCNEQLKGKIQHPCNLATSIGYEFTKEYNIPSYFVDPPSTFELIKIAEYSGLKQIKRSGKFHALNHKAVAKKYAKSINENYEDLNLIVAHLGGGVSIGAHYRGRVIDVTDGLGEGPFTPERAGSLPSRSLVDLCYSNKFSYEEMKNLLQGKGGLFSYLKTNNLQKIEEKILKNKNKTYLEIINAMVFQIAKEICAMSAPLNGEVDQIILTGGISYSKLIIPKLKKRIKHIANITVYPGEMEMQALALGVLEKIKGNNNECNK